MVQLSLTYQCVPWSPGRDTTPHQLVSWQRLTSYPYMGTANTNLRFLGPIGRGIL